jgi:hypothetical protein
MIKNPFYYLSFDVKFLRLSFVISAFYYFGEFDYCVNNHSLLVLQNYKNLRQKSRDILLDDPVFLRPLEPHGNSLEPLKNIIVKKSANYEFIIFSHTNNWIIESHIISRSCDQNFDNILSSSLSKRLLVVFVSKSIDIFFSGGYTRFTSNIANEKTIVVDRVVCELLLHAIGIITHDILFLSRYY